MKSSTLNKIIAICFYLLFNSGYSLSVLASAESDIDFIVNAKKPPPGVVFEIVEGSESAVEKALKKTEEYIQTLHTSLPNLKIAIVSHGVEEFALLKENKSRYAKSHNKVKSLVDNNIPFHVCGTHASWYGISNKDFPDYVDVAVAAPAKIKEYVLKGYALIKIKLT